VSYNFATGQVSVADHLTYDACGDITSQSNSANAPSFAYTGQLWDADAGLYYYRSRWYDPRSSRFLSNDPSGFSAGDANLQRYVFNDPVNAVDPTGEVVASGGVADPCPGDAGAKTGKTLTVFVSAVSGVSGTNPDGHTFFELADKNAGKTTGKKGFFPKNGVENINDPRLFTNMLDVVIV
jgi:RHS repeat-associated protein